MIWAEARGNWVALVAVVCTTVLITATALTPPPSSDGTPRRGPLLSESATVPSPRASGESNGPVFLGSAVFTGNVPSVLTGVWQWPANTTALLAFGYNGALSCSLDSTHNSFGYSLAGGANELLFTKGICGFSFAPFAATNVEIYWLYPPLNTSLVQFNYHTSVTATLWFTITAWNQVDTTQTPTFTQGSEDHGSGNCNQASQISSPFVPLVHEAVAGIISISPCTGGAFNGLEFSGSVAFNGTGGSGCCVADGYIQTDGATNLGWNIQTPNTMFWAYYYTRFNGTPGSCPVGYSGQPPNCRPPGGNPPPPGQPPPCPFWWSCLNQTLPQVVVVIVNQVCNLWLIVFLSMAAVAGAWARRWARNRAPPQEQPKRKS